MPCLSLYKYSSSMIHMTQKKPSALLALEPRTQTQPIHLGIIPDGNRRFAKQLLTKPWKGHEWGVEKVYKVFEWCRKRNVKTITFYALSLENMEKRPQYELTYLYNLARKELADIIENKNHFVHTDKVKLIFFGKLELLPKDLQDTIHTAMDLTKNYSRYTINFAIAYGGRQELVHATRTIANKVKKGTLTVADIDETLLRNNLLTTDMGDPDLIIRTGGEKRFSNFLLYQAAYSELAFTDTLWPNLTEHELTRMLDEFRSRERRFGR